ncbi:DUF922 domain-containing protein [Nonlabens sp.]|uniref:DUF922 domain-containing protein n=1 Tax=Nonlabens sp. TaxID=1888209 RepID=UPI003F6A4F2B
MKTALLFISLLITFSIVPEKKFTFQEKPVLTWDDFMGTPPRNASHAASVNSGIAYSYSIKIKGKEIILDFEVHSEFYPQLSWKKDLNESSSQLLAHEQLHWNISELHAQILKRAFQDYVPSPQYKKELRTLFNKVEAARQTMQGRYDRETNHGLHLSQQKEWETFIAQEFFKMS